MQHVLKMQDISLLPEHVKLISRVFFFSCSNKDCVKVKLKICRLLIHIQFWQWNCLHNFQISCHLLHCHSSPLTLSAIVILPGAKTPINIALGFVCVNLATISRQQYHVSDISYLIILNHECFHSWSYYSLLWYPSRVWRKTLFSMTRTGFTFSTTIIIVSYPQ